MPALSLGPVALNPTSDDVRATYSLAAPGAVRLTVYDVCGRAVAVLDDGARMPGRYSARLVTRGWAAGLYVLRLETGGTVQTRRFTVLR